MADKLLSSEDIRELLQPIVESVKSQVDSVNRTAIAVFYGSAGPGSYNRAGGFQGLGDNPQENWRDNGVDIIYTYSSGNVAVNSWDSPWGVIYPGDPGWAFDTGFVHGLHGGPRPTPIGWTWGGVPQTQAPWEIIQQGVASISV